MASESGCSSLIQLGVRGLSLSNNPVQAKEACHLDLCQSSSTCV